MSEKTTLKQAIEEMAENSRHGGIDVTCPQCSEVMRVKWGGGWKLTLDAHCLGREAGWLQWEDPCGLSFSNLAVDTAQMDAVLKELLPPSADKFEDDRRIGRGSLYPRN